MTCDFLHQREFDDDERATRRMPGRAILARLRHAQHTSNKQTAQQRGTAVSHLSIACGRLGCV